MWGEERALPKEFDQPIIALQKLTATSIQTSKSKLKSYEISLDLTLGMRYTLAVAEFSRGTVATTGAGSQFDRLQEKPISPANLPILKLIAMHQKIATN